MASMPINGSGITLVDMKSQKASPTPIQWKETMRNSVTIWHAWLANLVVSLVARMPSSVLSACLSSASTADNSTSNVSQALQPILWIS